MVPVPRAGFSASKKYDKVGWHASDTRELSFQDCRVPATNVLGERGRGYAQFLSTLDDGRVAISALSVGLAQGCVDESVAYAKERRQFGRPIAAFQLVQAMLADMKVETDAARMLVWRAGYLKDARKPNTTETSIAKLYATEAAIRCANTAIQVHGGAGYVDDHPVERYLRDVRVTTLYEGTSQIQKLIIGRALTGINALVPS
jgi:butyryl-CoA dehydrogenase